MSSSPFRPACVPRAARAATRRLAALTFALSAATAAQPLPTPPAWTLQLATDLAAIQLPRGTELGVHVQDLDSGAAVSHRADERWYLASLVQLPVAIAVLRHVEAGRYTLDMPLRQRTDDSVDGDGQADGQPLPAPLTLRHLLEQMMVHGDNTACDMLMALVGLDEVNAVVGELAPRGMGRITTQTDARRLVYGQLTPRAMQLRGDDLLRLRAQPTDAARLQLLARLVGEPVRQFRKPTLDAAYAAYYGEGLNSGRLDAYAGLLAALAKGKALGPEHTAWLLALMEHSQSGLQRIHAGLPPQARYAHKAGTQRRRTCDAGIVRTALAPDHPGVAVVACVRGEAPLPRAEAILRDVGRALCRTVLGGRNPQLVYSCPAAAPANGRIDPAAAAGAGPLASQP